MRRSDLEHVIRAAGAVANCEALVILGSQAVLGAFPDAPEELLISPEADLYPVSDPAKADLIDGSIGELSPFHEQYGYYAHGVSPVAAVLPKQWEERLIRVENANTNGIVGLCLHPTDLVISKLAAGRPKDVSFVEAMLQHGLVSGADLPPLLAELPEDHISRVEEALRRVLEVK